MTVVGTFELCNLRKSAEPPLEIRRTEGIKTDPMVDKRLHQTWHCWNYYGWGLLVLRSLGVWEEFLPVTWSAVTPTSWEHCHGLSYQIIRRSLPQEIIYIAGKHSPTLTDVDCT